MKRHPGQWSLSRIALALSIALATAATTRAAIFLNFEGLHDSEQIGNFYNGGYAGIGTGPGPNNGVIFGDDAVALISSESSSAGSLDFGNNPSGDTILHFTGSHAIMNVPAGFTNGFSLYYASSTEPGDVNIYSGLNGQGTLLARIRKPPKIPPFEYFDWHPAGVSFADVAHSVDFSQVTENSAFDNITLGASVPTPEPSTVVLLVFAALGLLAFTWRRPAGWSPRRPRLS